MWNTHMWITHKGGILTHLLIIIIFRKMDSQYVQLCGGEKKLILHTLMFRDLKLMLFQDRAICGGEGRGLIIHSAQEIKRRCRQIIKIKVGKMTI